MMYDVRRKSSRVETLSSLFRLLGLSKHLSSILIHTSYIIHTFTFYLLPPITSYLLPLTFLLLFGASPSK